MRLEVSFDLYQKNWYVGELYNSFFNFLKEIPGIEVEYLTIKELSEKHNSHQNNYSPSIFNIYNLFVTNKDTNKTFIHSLSDYAPAMMDDNSGITNFDVAAFSCSSNLTNEMFLKYNSKYKIIPSFYILEKWDDFDLIKKYETNLNKINKCYFNGLCYGDRALYKNIVSNNSFFNFKDKSDSNDYRTKESYYGELSSYNFGFSLDGAAKICYRDLEYFGLGVLCLREKLNILTNDPIVEGIHYIKLIDDDIKSMIYQPNQHNIVNDKLTEKIETIIMNNEYKDIINNSKLWFSKNCEPNNQIKLLFSFLQEGGIL